MPAGRGETVIVDVLLAVGLMCALAVSVSTALRVASQCPEITGALMDQDGRLEGLEKGREEHELAVKMRLEAADTRHALLRSEWEAYRDAVKAAEGRVDAKRAEVSRREADLTAALDGDGRGSPPPWAMGPDSPGAEQTPKPAPEDDNSAQGEPSLAARYFKRRHNL